VSKRRDIESLQLVLTSRCNLRCSYCYQSSKRKRRMAWKTLRAGLDLVLDSEPATVGITFNGGEPLLEFPLVRRAVDYVERHCPPGKIVTYHVSTNGTLLTESIVRFLERHDIKVQLSFDGVAPAQDGRARGTFSVLDRKLDRLREKHAGFYDSNLSVAVTVTPANLPYLADSVRYFLRKKVARISMMPSIVSDAAWDVRRIGELDRQLGRILAMSLVHLRKMGEWPVDILKNVPLPSPASTERPLMCGLVRGTAVTIDADGEAYGCNLLVSSYQDFGSASMRDRVEKLRLDRVDDPAFARRLACFPAAVGRARIFHRKDRKHSGYGRCAECRWLDECSMCPACILHVPGNSDPDRVSDFYCAFNRVLAKHRRRAPRGAALPEGPGQLPRLQAITKRWKEFAKSSKASAPR
jgi:sulfatase maturation enzyme AslB (radical SAM superfamily)